MITLKTAKNMLCLIKIEKHNNADLVPFLLSSMTTVKSKTFSSTPLCSCLLLNSTISVTYNVNKPQGSPKSKESQVFHRFLPQTIGRTRLYVVRNAPLGFSCGRCLPTITSKLQRCWEICGHQYLDSEVILVNRLRRRLEKLSL